MILCLCQDVSIPPSCLRSLKLSRSIEPFTLWVKDLFPQNFAESLIVVSSCLFRVTRARASVIHVRDTPNTQTNNNLSRSVYVSAHLISPINAQDASRQVKKIEAL